MNADLKIMPSILLVYKIKGGCWCSMAVGVEPSPSIPLHGVAM